MGLRLVVPFSLLIFVYFANLASSRRIQETLPSEFVQKSKSEDKEIYARKLRVGGVGGGRGGGARGIGGGSGGGGHGSGHGNGYSGMPKTGAGAAVIPVYAAGAAGANRNRQTQIHHSAAHSNLNKIHFSSMLMMTFVYPLILLFC